jgi:hypothetical protein
MAMKKSRPVSNGPFTQAQFPVKIEAGPTGSLRQTNHGLRQTNHGLRRTFAVNGATTLPKRARTGAALAETIYDQSP